jgi:hypothetical protein
MKATEETLREFTITKASGTKWGGKFRNVVDAIAAHSLGNDPIVSIEEVPLFSPEESKQLDREKAEQRTR